MVLMIALSLQHSTKKYLKEGQRCLRACTGENCSKCCWSYMALDMYEVDSLPGCGVSTFSRLDGFNW